MENTIRVNKKRIIAMAMLFIMAFTTLSTNISYGEKVKPVKIVVDGKELKVEILPVIEDDEVLLPLRTILEELGYSVEWDLKNWSVEAEKDTTNYIIKIGNKEITKTDSNTKEILKVDRPAELVKARTMVNLKFLNTITGLNIEIVEKGSEKVRLEDDFYEFVNSEWLKNAKIPADQPSVGGFNDIGKDISENLRRDFSNMLKNRSDSETKELKDFLNLYEATLNFEERNKQGLEPLKPTLKRIEEIKSVEDFNGKIKEFTLDGISTPLGIGVMQDMKHGEKNALYLSMPGIYLMDKSYYEEGNETGTMLKSAYKSMFEEMLVMAGKTKEEAEKITKEALEFDKLLATYSMSTEESSDIEKSYNPMKIADIAKNSKNIKIDNLIKSLLATLPEEAIVINVDYYKNIDKIINGENLDMIKSWMYINEINSASDILTEELDVLSNRVGMIISGTAELSSKEERAYDFASSQYGPVIGIYYADKYFSEKDKEDVTHMTKEFIEVYKERIKKLDWLTEETKTKALKKLDSMNIQIGYPEKVPAIFSEISYDKNKNLYENMEITNRKVMEDNYNSYNKPLNKDEWILPAHIVNATYMPLTNTITFPAGILQAPFYSVDQTASENYGGIGAVIAHEISHAFDPNGSKFDENGNMVNWWTEKDFSEFEKKTNEMIKLFDGIDFAGGKVNGKLTVGENIADAGGLSVAYEVASKSKDFNPEEFFNSWATIWRMKSNPEFEKMLLTMDTHSPNKLRANLQLSNLDEFYKHFDIKENDAMYLSPENRVKIW